MGGERDQDALREELETVQACLVTATEEIAELERRDGRSIAILQAAIHSRENAERERNTLRGENTVLLDALVNMRDERDAARAERDKVLDASVEGSWMARALDAECERDTVFLRLAVLEATVARVFKALTEEG